MKEKLIELIKDSLDIDAWDNGEYIEKRVNYEEVAKYLLANGVVVLPCKVGDTVYKIQVNSNACYECSCREYLEDDYTEVCNRSGLEPVMPPMVKEYPVCEKQFYEIISCKIFNEASAFMQRNKFGKSTFLTREEAEAEICRRERDERS